MTTKQLQNKFPDPADILAAIAFHFYSTYGLPEDIVIPKIWEKFNSLDTNGKLHVLADGLKFYRKYNKQIAI